MDEISSSLAKILNSQIDQFSKDYSEKGIGDNVG